MRKILAVLCLLCIFLTGCSSGTIANNAMGAAFPSQSARESAIEKEIEKIDGIHGSVVVIRGSAALIGLVIETGYPDTSALKSQAALTARQSDVNIKSTAVTCNIEITDMIRNLKNVNR